MIQWGVAACEAPLDDDAVCALALPITQVDQPAGLLAAMRDLVPVTTWAGTGVTV